MKKLSVILVASFVAVGLVACSAPANEATKKIEEIAKSEKNPNHFVIDAEIISLAETPKWSQLPLWKTEVDLPTNWKVDPFMASLDADDQLAIPEYFETLRFVTEDESCEITAYSEYMPSYNEGRGDLYISKNSLYEGMSSYDVLVQNEKTVDIKIDDKALQFVTADYDATIEMPAYSPETNEPTGDTQSYSIAGYRAVRGIDMLLANTERPPMENRFGTDPNKFVPVITVSYTCQDSKDLDSKTWETLLASLEMSTKNS